MLRCGHEQVKGQPWGSDCWDTGPATGLTEHGCDVFEVEGALTRSGNYKYGKTGSWGYWPAEGKDHTKRTEDKLHWDQEDEVEQETPSQQPQKTQKVIKTSTPASSQLRELHSTLSPILVRSTGC